MKINRIIETVIYCDNVEEAFNFYQNIFNFKVLQESFPRAVFLECGESVFTIFNRSMSSLEDQLPPPHGTHGPQHFAFEVDNEEYDKWKELFIQKSIPIEKEIAWGERNNHARSFYFRDPAGNNVEIAEKKLWNPDKN